MGRTKEKGEFPEDFENSPRTSWVVLQRDEKFTAVEPGDALMGVTFVWKDGTRLGRGDQAGLFGFFAWAAPAEGGRADLERSTRLCRVQAPVGARVASLQSPILRWSKVQGFPFPFPWGSIGRETGNGSLI